MLFLSLFLGGVSFFPLTSAQLRLGTVMYNPVGTLSIEAKGEWFELRNIGDQALDISGYFYSNKDPAGYATVARTLDTTAIPPGAFLIAARDENTFESNYPGYQADLIYGFDLANSADWLEIWNDDCMINANNNNLPDCARERLYYSWSIDPTRSPPSPYPPTWAQLQDCAAWSSPPEAFYRDWSFEVLEGYVLQRKNYDFPSSWKVCDRNGWALQQIDVDNGIGLPYRAAPLPSPSPGPTSTSSPSSSGSPSQSASPSGTPTASSSSTPAASSSSTPAASSSSTPAASSSSTPAASSSSTPAASSSSTPAPSSSSTPAPSSSSSPSQSSVASESASVSGSSSPTDNDGAGISDGGKILPGQGNKKESSIPWWIWLLLVALILLILWLLHKREVDKVAAKNAHFKEGHYIEGGETDIIAQTGYAKEIGPGNYALTTDVEALDDTEGFPMREGYGEELEGIAIDTGDHPSSSSSSTLKEPRRSVTIHTRNSAEIRAPYGGGGDELSTDQVSS